MSKPQWPYLRKQVTRHGRIVWYVRGRHHGRRVRLRAEYGTAEFAAEYQAALAEAPLRREPKGPTPGSLAWLIARYRETTTWTALSLATRRQRENIFKHVIAASGEAPVARITTAAIVAGRDRRKATPSAARNFLDAMRGLFRWAAEAGHVTADPTAAVKNPPRQAGPGFRMWTEEEFARYEARWPLGTRQRVWLDVLAYTGLRRGDAVRLGRQHLRNGIFNLKAEKTDTDLTLPLLPVLARTLAAGPCGDLAYIVGANGSPLTKESFGNEFRMACKAAGVPGSAHGIRKIAATRAAENGATEAELEAIFGWRGGRMAALYTRAANRARLAKAAMDKLDRENENATSGASPFAKTGPHLS